MTIFLLLHWLCATTVQSSQNQLAHNLTIVLDLVASESLSADSNITDAIIAVVIEDFESSYTEYTVDASTASLESVVDETNTYVLQLRVQIVSNTTTITDAYELNVDTDFLSADTKSDLEQLYDVVVNVDSVQVEADDDDANDNGEEQEEVPAFDDHELSVVFVFVVVVVMMLSSGTAILIKKCRNAVDTGFFVVSATNFASDIAVCVIVFMMYEWSHRAVHLYLCIACILFCALPLVLNIVYGVKNGCLESRKQIRNSLLLMATADAYYTLKLLIDVSEPRIKNMSMFTQYLPQIAIQCFLLYDFMPHISIIFAVSVALELTAAIGGVFVCREFTKRGFNKYPARLLFIVDEAEELQGIKQRHKENKFALQLKLAEILCVNKESIAIGGIWCITQRDCQVEILHLIPEEISNKQQYVHTMYENTMVAIGKLFKDVYGLITDIEPRFDEDDGFAMQSTGPSMMSLRTLSAEAHNAGGDGGNTGDAHADGDGDSDGNEVELGATSVAAVPMGMQTSISSDTGQPVDNKSLIMPHHRAQDSYIDI